MGADHTIDAAYIQSAGRNTSFTTKKLLLNPNGGNIGIGTISPSEKLDTPNIAIGGSTIAGFSANKLRIDNNGGNSRFYSTGANTTTTGSYQIHVTSSNGSINNPALTIASDTNATFAGSVTATTGGFLGTSNFAPVLTLGTAGAINAVINTADEMFFNIDSDNSQSGASFHFGHNSTTGNGSTKLMTIKDTGTVAFGPDAQDIQIIPSSTNSGVNKIYLRGNAVGDKAEISLNHYGSANMFIGMGMTAATVMSLTATSSGTDGIIINTSGKVGIGTAEPIGILSVDSGIAKTNTTFTRIASFKSSEAYAAYPLELSISQRGHATAGSQSIELQTGHYGLDFNANLVLNRDGGKVGIGTGSPAETLQIAQGGSILVGNYFQLGSGSSDVMGAIGWNRNTATGVIYNSNFGAFQMHNYQGMLALQGYNAAGTNQFQHEFSNNGNTMFDGNISAVIVTTSNDVRLTAVDARLRLGADGTGYGLVQRGQSGTGTATRLYFGEDTDTGLTMFRGSGHFSVSSAKVGLGTNSPTEALHISAGGSGPEIRLQNASGSHYIRAYNDNWNFLAGGTAAAITIKNNGNVGIMATSAISRFQSGSQTFTGGNGVHNNGRLGIMNNGNLTSIVNASTYNDATHPDYGLVLIQGPSTSSYNVWSISPDGPAKGDSLSFIYGAQATNIHSLTPKVVFDGNGNVGIGPTSKTWVPVAKLTIISGGADGIQLGADTTSGGNSGRIFWTNSSGGWAMMALGQVLSVRSQATPGSTSGTSKVQLTNYSSTAWTASSDESLKENINSIGNVLDKINDYRCVEYNLIDDEDKNKKIGFIAQDWQEDFPQIVEQMEDEKIGMKYTETIPILLKAIQELKAEIELLKSK
jgi:hypothetical protein